MHEILLLVCFIVCVLCVEWAISSTVSSAVDKSIQPLLDDILQLQMTVEELQPMAEAYNRYRYSDAVVERELWDSIRGERHTTA